MATSTTGVSDTTSREGPWLYVMLALLGTAGFFYVNLAAAIVDGLTSTLGFSSAQAGTVMSTNIYGASVGGLIAVFVVRRLPWRPVLVGLLCVVLALELASLMVHSYGVLLPLRAVDGLVGGMSVGVALSLLARTRFPDRAFGSLLAFQFAFGGLGSWWLPELVKEHGTWVLFACMAAMDVAAVITAIFLRMRDTPRLADGVATANLPATRSIALTVATLLALFLFQAANMGLFAFIIPLGQSHALTLSFISRTVGWTTWIGTLGALFVIVFGTKFGRTRPLSVAMVVTLIGIAALYWSSHSSVFFAANASTAITWSFVVPYLFGIVSMLDRTGRLATLAGFISGLGLASGPLFAGWVVGPNDYGPLISMGLAFLVIATVAMLVAARRVDGLGRTMATEVV
ncbi:MAG: MFS transporter [Rhodanobacteraceae bacterium]